MQKTGIVSCGPRCLLRRATHGFTLPELIATMVIIGIMAAVVVPRFANRADFDVFGVTQQTRAALRFAQKSAIAKRRQVCVTIASNSLDLTFGTTFVDSCSGFTCAANPANCLTNPATGKGYTLPVTSGISITAASFYFSPLGKPSAAQSLTVSGGSSTQTITVEAETGYVH
ncbi:MAG: prepilin-type N-terminal cleavage/methylation protein [Proteobacteria bacterium]|nr:prepilin-type N-terminal cleavage/methylation protein [Pseudomonadota bacterium]